VLSRNSIRSRSARCGRFKLRLQPCQAIEQLVALGLQLVEFFPAHRLRLSRRRFDIRCCRFHGRFCSAATDAASAGSNTVNFVSSFGISLRTLRNIVFS